MIELEHPLMNAAGTVKYLAQVQRLAKAPVSAIVAGSYTMLPRTGNSGEVYYSAVAEGTGDWVINRLGLPNPGIAYLATQAQFMKEALGDRPLIVSIAPFSVIELRVMCKVCSVLPIDGVEVNLGCPNTEQGIPSFKTAVVRNMLTFATSTLRDAQAVGLKLSPYSDPALLDDVLSVLAPPYVPPDFLTLSNSFPNAWCRQVGYGGLSGPAVKPMVMGQISQFVDRSMPGVQIFAAGGLRTADDVHDYLKLGADATQFASGFLDADENPRWFSDLLDELVHAP